MHCYLVRVLGLVPVLTVVIGFILVAEMHTKTKDFVTALNKMAVLEDIADIRTAIDE